MRVARGQVRRDTGMPFGCSDKDLARDGAMDACGRLFGIHVGGATRAPPASVNGDYRETKGVSLPWEPA